MVIFLYNLDIFVWMQHGYLANTVFTLDLSNHVIKRLWCLFYSKTRGISRYFLFLHNILHSSYFFSKGQVRSGIRRFLILWMRTGIAPQGYSNEYPQNIFGINIQKITPNTKGIDILIFFLFLHENIIIMLWVLIRSASVRQLRHF